MSLVMVGATVVGKIGTSFMGELKRQKQAWTQTLETPITFNKGDELGYFKLGSTVILLWSNETNLAFKHKVGDTVQLGESLVPERGLEPPRDFSH
jgi:phosphatidylserine decarboxylase